MSQELIYTSAARGLKPGSRGFCTVACTQGIASNLVKRLESLSGYRHLFQPTDPNASLNPVSHSHLSLNIGGHTYHTLSRVCAAGLDYTRRTNKLAHHLVFEPNELPTAGPADLLADSRVMESEWTGDPRLITKSRSIPTAASVAQPCNAWKQMTGDAGWAGAVAETAVSGRKVILLFKPGMEMLPLFQEAIALLPTEYQWRVTFSTYFTKLPPSVDCQWCCVLADTPEAIRAKGQRGALVLDLTGPVPPLANSAAVEAAQQGTMILKSSEPKSPSMRSSAPPATTPPEPASATPLADPIDDDPDLWSESLNLDDDGLIPLANDPASIPTAVPPSGIPQRKFARKIPPSGVGVQKKRSLWPMLAVAFIALFLVTASIAVGLGIMVWKNGDSDNKQQAKVDTAKSTPEATDKTVKDDDDKDDIPITPPVKKPFEDDPKPDPSSQGNEDGDSPTTDDSGTDIITTESKPPVSEAREPEAPVSDIPDDSSDSNAGDTQLPVEDSAGGNSEGNDKEEVTDSPEPKPDFPAMIDISKKEWVGNKITLDELDPFIDEITSIQQITSWRPDVRIATNGNFNGPDWEVKNARSPSGSSLAVISKSDSSIGIELKSQRIEMDKVVLEAIQYSKWTIALKSGETKTLTFGQWPLITEPLEFMLNSPSEVIELVDQSDPHNLNELLDDLQLEILLPPNSPWTVTSDTRGECVLELADAEQFDFKAGVQKIDKPRIAISLQGLTEGENEAIELEFTSNLDKLQEELEKMMGRMTLSEKNSFLLKQYDECGKAIDFMKYESKDVIEKCKNKKGEDATRTIKTPDTDRPKSPTLAYQIYLPSQEEPDDPNARLVLIQSENWSDKKEDGAVSND